MFYELDFMFAVSCIFLLIMAVVFLIVGIKKNKEYKNCAYYKITKKSLISIFTDKGKYGEYYTYKYLKKL